MGIEPFGPAAKPVSRKTIDMTVDDALVVIDVEVDDSLDRLSIICLARGRPCQIVMMRYNVQSSFRLISRYEEDV